MTCPDMVLLNYQHAVTTGGVRRKVSESNIPSTSNGLVGTGSYEEVSSLQLDAQNPRFPVDAPPGNQAAVAKQIADRYEALDIARKIATEGFHVAEPPAVVVEDGKYVVVEGNRRVTALKALLDPELRKTFADAEEWEEVAKAGRDADRVPHTIPVIIYPDRNSAKPLLGQRHIRGQLKWEPLQQARFIEGLIADGNSFEAVAQMTNLRVGEVRSMYRNYRLITVDARRLGIVTKDIEKKFTVLGNVLDNKTLREHAGVIADSEVRAGKSSLAAADDAEARPPLAELLKWVLGDSSTPAVLPDSRKVVKLGQVVAVKVGLAALRAGKSLDDALQDIADEGSTPLESATRMLTVATNTMTRAKTQVQLLSPAEKDAVAELVAKFEAAFESVTVAYKDGRGE